MKQNIVGALPSGTKLHGGDYTIERVLGQGASGITYLAAKVQQLQGALGIFNEKVYVAIKEFYFKEDCHRESTTQNVLVANANNEARVSQYKHSFVKEARRLAGLSHKNIVHVLDIFEENSTVYYVMQYIREGSIKDKIEREGALNPDQAVKYAAQVASALSYMHGKKMCHYDLKPGNIMLSSDDNAMIIDFGISKNYDENGQETSTMPPGLTKGFAPMEQYSSITEFSPASDVYSLGATLYAMLLGTTPPEPMKWLEKGFTPCPDNVHRGLWKWVEKAMSVSTLNRPTAKELEEVLRTKSYLNDYDEEEYTGETIIIEPHPDVFPGGRDDLPPIDPIKPEPKQKSRTPQWVWTIFLVIFGLSAAILSYTLFSGSQAGDSIDADSLQLKEETMIYDSQGEAIMSFTGVVDHGRPDGEGVLVYKKDPERDRYEGTLVKGKREAENATLYYKNGDTFTGSFKNDMFQEGTYTIKSTGEWFRGKFKDNHPWNGVWYDKNSNVLSRVDEGKEF